MIDERPQWVRRIKVGDVLRFRKGQLRTVISVRHGMNAGGRMTTSVSFPIKRCSWTRRGTTSYVWYELLSMGARPTIARVNVEAYPVARKLLEEMRSPRSCHMCCETIGVFE